MELRLTLTIDTTRYSVTPEHAPGRVFRLKQADGDEGYRLERVGPRIVCSCPDYRYRRQATPRERCKHGHALEVMGLV